MPGHRRESGVNELVRDDIRYMFNLYRVELTRIQGLRIFATTRHAFRSRARSMGCSSSGRALHEVGQFPLADTGHRSIAPEETTRVRMREVEVC